MTAVMLSKYLNRSLHCISALPKISLHHCRCLYEQGQSPKRGIREYFYYVDHQGQLFMDDARIKNFTSCFKEKDFLEFFYKRVKVNNTGRYEKEFPFVSPCGREKNYIRCDDLPIVFTHVIESSNPTEGDRLIFGYVGDRMSVPFEPEGICMVPESGRVYHPAEPKVGGVGLIKSALAIELSQFFGYEDGDDDTLKPPTTFEWKGTTYNLHNELLEKLRSRSYED